MYYLLGIDAGTTSFKAALFNENGKMVSSAGKSYKLNQMAGSIVEFNAEGYWKIFRDVISLVLQKSGVDPELIKALAIDSQGETLIPVDRNGTPLCNAIVWLDNRAVESAAAIECEFNQTEVYQTTGQPEVSATWPASKILWLKDNRPDIYGSAYKYLLLEDYLIFRLTGKYATEKTLLTSTLYLDIRTGRWWKDMLRYIGIDEGQLPQIMNSAECVSKLSERAARELSLPKDMTVVTGALDQVAGMIGAGNIGERIISETTGTCLGVCVNTDKIPIYKEKVSVPCHIHAIQDRYYLILWSQAAGLVLEWFRNEFYEKKASYALVDKEAGATPPGADGLLMLPHLNGVAYPDFDPNPKGVFYGIRPVHGRGHFSRAIMESIAYMLKEHIDIIHEIGLDVGEIRSLGGGAASSLWNKIKCDVTGKKIITLENPETTCLGAAILAGKGIGMFSSIEKACKRFVHTKDIYQPDISNKAVYEKSFEAYRMLYECLKGLFAYH